MTREDERRVFEGQYVALQPSLDGTHMRVMGKLGAYEGELCRKALNQLGDRLIPAGETRPDPVHRRALALTALCEDELDRDPHSGPRTDNPDASSSGKRREPLLMVVAHHPLAGESGYQQGAAVLAGARVGGHHRYAHLSGPGRTRHRRGTEPHPLRLDIFDTAFAAPSSPGPR